MARLIYSMLASLDGYVEDESGDFSWAAPDEEVHGFANELERAVGTHLLGRRMYETMTYWETAATEAGADPVEREFAQLWRATDKVVYSRTLQAPSTERTRLEAELEPAAVAAMKEAAERDLSVAGPELAAQALAAGLVDELQLFVAPVVVGAGKPWLPADLRLDLSLLEQRRFAGGMVYLRYALGSSPTST
jgi:dihydrofolate reductase